MATFKCGGLIRKEFFDLIWNIINNGGLYLSTNAIKFQEIRLENFRKIVSALNEDIDSRDKLIAFLLEEVRTSDLKSYISYVENLFEIAKNKNAEEIFLEQDNLRYTLLKILPAESDYNIYVGIKRLDFLALFRRIIKNHVLLKVIKMSLDNYLEEMERCKPGSRKGLFKNYVKCLQEIYFVLSNTINNFNETTSDDDIIESSLSASVEFHCSMKSQEILGLVVECSVYGMLGNNRKNIENRIKYTKQLLDLLRESYDECNDKLLNIISRIRKTIEDKINPREILKGNNYLLGGLDDISETICIDTDFLDLIQRHVYNNPNYESFLLEYIADQNIMRIILSYGDRSIEKTDKEIFANILKNSPDRIEVAFDKIIKEFANDRDNFDKITNILWFHDISLVVAKCIKDYDSGEYGKYMDVVERLMESICYLVTKKLATNTEKTEAKLKKMDFIISNIKNNVIAKYLLDDIYVSIKNTLTRVIEKEERNNNIEQALVDRGLMEYIGDLKNTIEQNLNSEEAYQEYVRFETLRNKICISVILGQLEDNQDIVREIIVILLNWRDDRINVLEYEINNYRNVVEYKVYCQNIEGLREYKKCIILIKRLQRLVSLVLDCAENNMYLPIDIDFIETCIKLEVAIQYLYIEVLVTSDDALSKKIYYREFIEKTFEDEKYIKYLNIDDFLNMVEENNRDYLEYYEEIGNQLNWEWQKRIKECSIYTRNMIEESIASPEKSYEFFLSETLRNSIYKLGILNLRDVKTVNKALNLPILESKQYFELFKKVFDFEIDNYTKALSIQKENSNLTESLDDNESYYQDCLDKIINFKNIIIPLFEITKNLDLNTEETNELINNFFEIEEILSYLIDNNLSPEESYIIKKVDYMDYLQSIINKPLIKDMVKIVLDALEQKLDSLINIFEEENDDYELLFKFNEKNHIAKLESIIANNSYEQYKNNELTKNNIYSIAILGDSSTENIKSLVVKIKNSSPDLFKNIVSDLIFIRRCLCDINSNEVSEEDIVKYQKQIVLLERTRDKILSIFESSKNISTMDDIIYSYDKLKEALYYIVDHRLANSETIINKKIEYTYDIENILTKDNFNILIAQIFRELKADFSDKLNEYSENKDKYNIQFFRDKQVFEYLDEIELNLINSLKKYLNNYRIKEQVRNLIGYILDSNNIDSNTKKLIKITLENMEATIGAFDYDIYAHEVTKNRVINIEGKREKETEYDDCINNRYVLKDKILVLAESLNGSADEDEFNKLFKNNSELYSEIKRKIVALTRNIIYVYNERTFLQRYFYSICNISCKSMTLCALKDIRTDYQRESKNIKYQNIVKLAKLSLKKLDELEQKIKNSEDRNKFIEYIEEYKIICHMETVGNHYYDNKKIEFINNYIDNRELCEKVFNNIIEEAKEYDNIYDQNSSANIVDFRNLIEELADEVKDINDIEERTAILYKKYFLKDYAGWNIFIGLYYNNLINFDNKSVKERSECINRYLFLIRKYKCESEIDSILAIVRNKLEKEINDKIINRRNGNYVLYQDNTTMDIFDELCNNIRNKFIKDQKYLCDYFTDEIKLSNFHDNWINGCKYIEDRKYFILGVLNDENRIRDLFNRYKRGYNHISKEYYLDSEDSYRCKVAINRAEELEKEIFEIAEKVKDIENKLEQESMINTLLIADWKLKESFDNIFKFDEYWKGDINYIEYSIGRFINLGFYYNNGKKELMNKLFRDKYDEIEININKSTEDIYKTANLIFDRIQLDNLIETLNNPNIDYNEYCQTDRRIILLMRSLLKGIFVYGSTDTFITSVGNNSYYHRGSIAKELIYTIKQCGIDKFKRIVDKDMLFNIDRMYDIFRDIKPVEYEVTLIENKDYPLYRKDLEVISNNIIKTYELLEKISKDNLDFRTKLNDTILSLEILSQLEYLNNYFYDSQIATIDKKTILDRLRDVIDRSSEVIFDLAVEIIISENQIYNEVLDNNYIDFLTAIEFFKNVRRDMIGEK